MSASSVINQIIASFLFIYTSYYTHCIQCVLFYPYRIAYMDSILLYDVIDDVKQVHAHYTHNYVVHVHCTHLLFHSLIFDNRLHRYMLVLHPYNHTTLLAPLLLLVSLITTACTCVLLRALPNSTFLAEIQTQCCNGKLHVYYYTATLYMYIIILMYSLALCSVQPFCE